MSDMKDYKHIEHMRNLNDSLIWERMKRCYDYGYEDGQKEKLANAMIHDYEVAEKTAYERGLNDAWDVVKKIALMDTETSENITGYFGLFRIMNNLTASEAIAKIKAYEDKQKADDEIKVGYEVYNIDRENKRIVTAIDGNKAIQLCSNGKYTVDNIDTLHWTGREDLRIKKVLEKITNEV